MTKRERTHLWQIGITYGLLALLILGFLLEFREQGFIQTSLVGVAAWTLLAPIVIVVTGTAILVAYHVISTISGESRRWRMAVEAEQMSLTDLKSK